MTTEKRLYRSRRDRMFLGVLGGLAEYLDMDPTVVRLLFILLSLTPFPGLLAYIIMAVVVPLAPPSETEIAESRREEAHFEESPRFG